MVAELAATSSDVRATRSGTFGILGAETATPLAMTLTEVLQNAVEHGLDRRGGAVLLTAARSDGRLLVTVEDDGVGLPAGFDAATTGNLGLQIVRTLVVGELSGTLDIGPRTDGGTRVVLDLPVKAEPPR